MSKSSTKPTTWRLVMTDERCKGCGYCIEFCPKKSLNQSDDINSKGYHLVSMEDGDKCTGCNICTMVCPDFAIRVVGEESEKGRN